MRSISELQQLTNTLQAKIDEYGRKAERLRGKLDAANESLKQLGFTSVEDAEKWLITATNQIKEDTVKLNKLYDDFMEQYGGHFE